MRKMLSASPTRFFLWWFLEEHALVGPIQLKVVNTFDGFALLFKILFVMDMADIFAWDVGIF